MHLAKKQYISGFAFSATVATSHTKSPKPPRTRARSRIRRCESACSKNALSTGGQKMLSPRSKPRSKVTARISRLQRSTRVFGVRFSRKRTCRGGYFSCPRVVSRGGSCRWGATTKIPEKFLRNCTAREFELKSKAP